MPILRCRLHMRTLRRSGWVWPGSNLPLRPFHGRRRHVPAARTRHLWCHDCGEDVPAVCASKPFTSRTLTHTSLQYISRTDTSVLSRVNTHYALLLNYAAICSPVSIMALYMVERKVIPAASVTCRATMFTSWQCIPLGINFVFPYVLAVTAFSASQFLRRRALAIHGSALVAVPPPVPRPWLWLDKDVPAWRAPHLAEFESPVSVEDGVAERHNTKLPALA
ncbi:hypothetical protein C8F04DRAFT_554374 [Mycena alexandri]|uniref:Uncharacterized protein n=1 Tax=Mycena alexandri TaxID=1745969 RepID=A0AAD6SUF2_9AGAR|nr:hypothetical protein C8F04DRAFT_649567 [Mycena alexandri]KAJ7034806.1 hypothetical protein C8F04DRAFT_554374 [Mycena alexandri]